MRKRRSAGCMNRLGKEENTIDPAPQPHESRSTSRQDRTPTIARVFRIIALASTGLSIFASIPAAGQFARQNLAVIVTPSSAAITTAQSLSVTVDVTGANGSSAPTGTVVLTSGSYSLPPSLPYRMPTLSGFYHSSLTTTNLTANSGLGNSTVTYVDAKGANQRTATGVAAATAGHAGNATVRFRNHWTSPSPRASTFISALGARRFRPITTN